MTTKPLNQIAQLQAYKLVLWQLVGVLICALLAFCVAGVHSSLSVLAGGLAYGLTNPLFVWRVFRYAGAHQMTQFIIAFFLGEMLKLFLSAIFILLIVKYWPVSLLSVLAGFIGAIVSFWIVCMWQFSRQTGANT